MEVGTGGYHCSALWSGHLGNPSGSSRPRLGHSVTESWMRQTCTGIPETKYKNKLAVELSERVVIQAEAAKELKQGSEGVRKRAIGDMQLQGEVRGAGEG